MKRVIQLTSIMLLGAGFMAHADVQFELTNKSSQPIWVCVYADGDPATGEFQDDCEKMIAPSATLSQKIANGEVEMTISIVDPSERSSGRDRFRTYKTSASADNKDKILVWDYTKSATNPLYPGSKRFLGIMKTKISDNITQRELFVSKNKGL